MAQVLSLIFVFFYYLSGIDLSSWMTSLTTTLIFLGDLGQNLISERRIVGLSLVFVLVEKLIAILLIGIFLVFLPRRLISF